MWEFILGMLPWSEILTALIALLLEYFLGKTNLIEANSTLGIAQNAAKKVFVDRNQKI